MRRIAIRIDDITPGMDWDKFSRFAELLDRYGIRPLIGLVPRNEDPLLEAGDKRNPAFDDKEAYAAWLKERREAGWIFAQHGTTHVYSTKKAGIFPLNSFSEFAGVELKRQYLMLREGKEELRKLGAESDIFMAPGHSFDKNTLRALKKLGFRYITDGYGSHPYSRGGLIFLPISFLRSRELKKEYGVTTYVVHCAEMTEEEYDRYEKLFREQRERFIDYGELLKLPARERVRGASFVEYIYATAKHIAGRIINHA